MVLRGNPVLSEMVEGLCAEWSRKSVDLDVTVIWNDQQICMLLIWRASGVVEMDEPQVMASVTPFDMLCSVKTVITLYFSDKICNVVKRQEVERQSWRISHQVLAWRSCMFYFSSNVTTLYNTLWTRSMDQVSCLAIAVSESLWQLSISI